MPHETMVEKTEASMFRCQHCLSFLYFFFSISVKSLVKYVTRILERNTLSVVNLSQEFRVIVINIIFALRITSGKTGNCTIFLFESLYLLLFQSLYSGSGYQLHFLMCQSLCLQVLSNLLLLNYCSLGNHLTKTPPFETSIK